MRNPNGAAVRPGSGDGRSNARTSRLSHCRPARRDSGNLKPDIAALTKIDMGIGGAIITAAGENAVDYVCGSFAPSEGIDEDPATGSIQCTLVPYWARRTGKQTFRVQQLSSRGARMWCMLVGDRVKIAGEVKLYLQGTINI